MPLQKLRSTIDVVAATRKQTFNVHDLDERIAMVEQGTWDNFFLKIISAQTKQDTTEFKAVEWLLINACLAHLHKGEDRGDHCPLTRFHNRLISYAANRAAHWFFAGYYFSEMAELQRLQHDIAGAEQLLQSPDWQQRVKEMTHQFIKHDKYLAPFFYRGVQEMTVETSKLLKAMIKDDSADMDKAKALDLIINLVIGGSSAANFDLGCRVYNAVSDERKLARL